MYPAARVALVALGAVTSACLEPPLPAASSAAKGAENPMAAEVIVWDGEPAHAAGSGWASCEDDRPGACEARLEARAGAGRDGGVALHFSARGGEWLGFGWNWFGWWPAEAGTDIANRKSLALAIKVVAAPGKGPEPFTLRVALGGSARDGQDATESIPIIDFAAGFTDGRWHDVVLPMSALLRGKGEQFDTYRAWSFTVGAWNQGEREYEVFVDDVRFR